MFFVCNTSNYVINPIASWILSWKKSKSSNLEGWQVMVSQSAKKN